jgi:hypothetical protein
MNKSRITVLFGIFLALASTGFGFRALALPNLAFDADCAGVFGAFSGGSSDADLGLLPQWRKHPNAYPGVEVEVQKTLKLSPAERKAELARLNLHHFSDPRAEKAYRLILFDESAWTGYLQDLARRGDFYGILSNSFYEVIEQMPEDLSSKLLKEVAQLYPTAGKEKLGRVDAPKRAIDLFLRIRVPADEMIASGVSSGKSPIQAYDAYLSRMREVFKEVGYVNYNAADVLDLATTLQKSLYLIPSAEFKDKSLTFFGSFPSGRGLIGKSDLDFSYSDPKLDAYLPQLQAAVRAVLKTKGIDLELELSGHLSSDYDPRLAARISPVQIKITDHSVDLLLFPKITLETYLSETADVKPVVFSLRD